ncbi:Phosphatidylinositol 3,4,5-trisphosphate-dependent Rac exchanger 1 protein [Sciurus carolinensis]|uniref:Phosphatidylinositol 3,4,5-trisphosphate-dependent Rac exchanger 1 protein n=1 Tax=Sciurus carolinensis TaxID=30640 RepID=A0AA41T487_SCICA|nr:Phosphatidylinositol 3,4,5-trisphosphate-dependent Rac exchanger 1 protein [Sciurus carolinensis]
MCIQLLLQGTLLKISVGNIQERAFFLFNNFLVYCKWKSRVTGSKKSTKRIKSIDGSLYIWGQINTEVIELEIVENGTADYHSNGNTVTNDWKIHNTTKNKFVCMVKMAKEKHKWLDTITCKWEQRDSLKLGMERDAYIMIMENGEKLYHLMMRKKVNLIKDGPQAEHRALVLPGQMAGLQEGRQIYSNNKDLVLLQPFSLVESLLNQCFCSHHPLHLLVTTKAKETIKVPDHPEALCFQIRGAALPCVYTMGRGFVAVTAGLSASQCILKVNCSSTASKGALGVLEHFQAFWSCGQEVLGLFHWIYHTHRDAQEMQASQETPGEDPHSWPLLFMDPQLSLCEDGPVVSLMVDNVDLEPRVVYEYVSTVGVWCHVLERIVEPHGCFGLTAKILEAFAADDSAFLQNCMWLMVINSVIVTTSHYDFHNICDTKLESIDQRTSCYQEVSAPRHPNPMSYTQHCITTVAAPSWKCLPVVDGVAQGQTLSNSSGPARGTLSQEDWGLSSLLKQEDHEVQDAYLQLFTKLDVALKEMKQYITLISRLLSTITEPHSRNSNWDSVLSYTRVRSNSSYLGSDEMGSGCMSPVDLEEQGVQQQPCDMCILWDKKDKLHGCLEHIFNQVVLPRGGVPGSLQSPGGGLGALRTGLRSQGFCLQVDTIKVLLKGLVMGRAFEETKNFPMEHNLQDRKNQLFLGLLKCTDTKLQLRRDIVFCQVLVTAMCTFSKQLLVALSYCYNNKQWRKEEWTMLEDIWVTLLELESVTLSFKQLDENCVATLENVEGPPPPDRQTAEDFQQETNAQSLENIQQYYHKLRTLYLEPSNLPMDSSTTAMKTDQEHPEPAPGAGSYPGLEPQAAAQVHDAGHGKHEKAGPQSGDSGQKSLSQGSDAPRVHHGAMPKNLPHSEYSSDKNSDKKAGTLRSNCHWLHNPELPGLQHSFVRLCGGRDTVSSRGPHLKQDEVSNDLMQREKLKAEFPEILIPRHLMVGTGVVLLEIKSHVLHIVRILLRGWDAGATGIRSCFSQALLSQGGKSVHEHSGTSIVHPPALQCACVADHAASIIGQNMKCLLQRAAITCP